MRERSIVDDGQLSIINTQKMDSGLYECGASNEIGFDSAVTQLNVVELPRFTRRPPSLLEINGVKNISVACEATGDPQPKITWTRVNGQLPVGRSEVRVDGTLVIRKTNSSDTGTYTCVASSAEVLKSFSIMNLIVKGMSVCYTVWLYNAVCLFCLR